jgi:hypothetical protein
METTTITMQQVNLMLALIFSVIGFIILFLFISHRSKLYAKTDRLGDNAKNIGLFLGFLALFLIISFYFSFWQNPLPLSLILVRIILTLVSILIIFYIVQSARCIFLITYKVHYTIVPQDITRLNLVAGILFSLSIVNSLIVLHTIYFVAK